jgi:hypothetical protein
MAQDYLKYYKSKILILLVVYVTSILLWLKSNWGIALSITSVLGILIWTIDKFLWKFKPFIWMFNIDDFSGRYEGQIKYEYKDASGNLQTNKLKHIKMIHQTGSSITVNSFTVKDNGEKSSLSVNKGMFVEKTPDGQHYQLILDRFGGYREHDLVKKLNKSFAKSAMNYVYQLQNAYNAVYDSNQIIKIT